MKFEKTRYYMAVNDNGTYTAQEADGYGFGLAIDGTVWRFCTHRNERGNWELTEWSTGFAVAPHLFGTRREVAAYAESAEFAEKFGDVARRKRLALQAQADVFSRIVGGEKMSVEDYRKAVDELAARYAEAEKKPEPEPDERDKRIADLERQLEAARAEAEHYQAKACKWAAKAADAERRLEERSPAPQAPEIEAVEKLTVETAREWAASRGLRYERKNDNSPCWLLGIGKHDKELHDELKEAGFLPGRSKKYGYGWWAKSA